MADDDRLSTNQRRALAALLSQPTVRAAAETAKLSEATLYRYLRQGAFKTELRARQDAILAATTAAMVGLSGGAVTTLQGVLNDPNASASVKVRAALGWLSHTRDVVKLDDLIERVDALERAILP